MSNHNYNKIVLVAIHEWDGISSLEEWVTNPGPIMARHSATYTRLQSHAISVGLDIKINFEHPRKLIVTINI